MKKAVERKLGLRPTREESVKEYFQLHQMRSHWRRDVETVQSIIDTLQELYDDSADLLPPCRYGVLRDMAVVTVADYHRFSDLREARLQLETMRGAPAIGDGNDPSSGEQSPRTSALTSVMSRLKGNAMAIASIQQELKDWEDISTKLNDVPTKNIHKYTDDIRAEILRLEWQYVNVRNKLEYLSDQVEYAQTACCLCRYKIYKNMIEGILLDGRISALGPEGRL